MEAEQFLPIIEAAVRAPSVHNTQPWRFAVHPDSNGQAGHIDLFADRERMLAVADPVGRELHISCGCAVEFARIAARSMWRACSVQLLPDPADPDFLARLTIGERNRPSLEEGELARALPLRYTERGPFEERALPASLIDRLERSVRHYDAWLRVLDRESDQTVAAVLLALADEIERAESGYEEELASWSRAEPGSPDGVPVRSEAHPRAATFKPRAFGVGAQPDPEEPEELPPRAEHPLIALLGTPGDDVYYWLEAGQALARLLLTATAAGVGASPMTQLLEVESTRDLLTRELGLVGHPQVLLRMGFAHGHPTTPRRPVSEVIIPAAPEPRSSETT